VQSNNSEIASAAVVIVSQSNNISVDSAVTSSGTAVQYSSVPRQSVLPPATSVEAVERTGVSSAHCVNDLQNSSSTESTCESSTLYSPGREFFRLDIAVDIFSSISDAVSTSRHIHCEP